MTITDALEFIGELPSLRHCCVAITLASNDDVDALHYELGTRRDESGRRTDNREDAPRNYTLDGASGWWREATVVVAGVVVTFRGPMMVGAEKEAA